MQGLGKLVWREQAKAAGEEPGGAGGESEADTESERDGAEDEDAGVWQGVVLVQKKERDAEDAEEDGGLHAVEDGFEGGGAGGVELGNGTEEVAAGGGFRVGEQAFGGGELIEQAGLDGGLRAREQYLANGTDDNAGDGRDGNEEEEGDQDFYHGAKPRFDVRCGVSWRSLCTTGGEADG